MPISSDVNIGDVILASDHNELREDVLDPSTGHTHEGGTDEGRQLDFIKSMLNSKLYIQSIDFECADMVITSPGTTSFRPCSIQIQTNNVSGTFACIYGNMSANTTPSWSVDRLFFTTVYVSEVGVSQDVIFGFYDDNTSGAPPANATITTKHIAFLVDDSTMYASNANGTSQTRTDITSGITVNQYNNYLIEVDSGTSIKFYVNGTLVATHTTYMPSGSQYDITVHWAIETQSAAYRTLHIIPNAAFVDLSKPA